MWTTVQLKKKKNQERRIFTVVRLTLVVLWFLIVFLKLLLLYCTLRQWRRGNIALITTLPVPDCQYSGCNLCSADGEKNLLLSRGLRSDKGKPPFVSEL